MARRRLLPRQRGGPDAVSRPDGNTYEDGAPGGSAAYADGEGSTAPDSQTFVTEPFEADTRVSGQFGFEFGIIADGTDATVAVEILDVPPGADPGDDATTTMTPDREAPLLASYAWIRAWYRDTVPMRGMSIPHDGEPLSPGSIEEIEFGSLYTDLVVEEGHRLAFRVSNAAGGTLGSEMGGDVRILCGSNGSRVNVPTAPPAGSEPPRSGGD